MEKKKYFDRLDLFLECNKEIIGRIEKIMSEEQQDTAYFERLDDELKVLQNATNTIREHSINYVHYRHVAEELECKDKPGGER